MKTVILLFGLLFSTFCLQAQDYEDVMSEAYWKIWNSDVRASIDKNIDKNTGREAFDVKKFFCYSELNYGKQEYKSVWILKWEKLSK